MDVDPAHYSAAVDVTGFAPGRHMLPVRVEAPTRYGTVTVRLVSLRPANATQSN